jgi:hypothetical protein
MNHRDTGRPVHEHRRSTGAGPASVAGALRLATGLTEDARVVLVRVLAPLDARLAHHPAGRVELEVSPEDRGTPGQSLTLECRGAGQPRPVASSAQRQLDVAVRRVCEGLGRQLDDTDTRVPSRTDRLVRHSAPAERTSARAAGPSPRTARRSPGRDRG